MEDTRCCGTGTCIINAQSYCWCGQKWDGEKMCFPDKTELPKTAAQCAAAPSRTAQSPFGIPSKA
jgi:hypothetical protein